MEFVELRAFVAASRTGTISGAATALHLTSAPVSRAIKHFEQHLGGELFQRDYHHLSLTSLGERVLPTAVHALAQLRLLDGAAHGAAPLRIGASLWAPDRFVDALVAAADETSSAEISRTTSNALVQALAYDEIDFALVHDTPLAPGVCTRALADYVPAFFVDLEHPLAQQKQVWMADLAGFPFAIPAEFHRRLSLGGILTQLRDHGITAVVDLPHGDQPGLARTVRELNAVTIGTVEESTPMLRRSAGHGLTALKIIDDPPRLSLSLAWRGLADVSGSSIRRVIETMTPFRPEPLK